VAGGLEAQAKEVAGNGQEEGAAVVVLRNEHFLLLFSNFLLSVLLLALAISYKLRTTGLFLPMDPSGVELDGNQN